MVLSHLAVTKITHHYIIIVARTALHNFTVKNTKGSTASTKKYLIIKRTLFLFKKKFAITGNQKKYWKS